MMKKYAFLTSVLALAACGGGGHSGGGAIVPSQPSLDLTVPDGMRAAVGTDISASNSNVTGMKSEVLVATSGGKSVVVSREPMTQTNSSGVTFTSYRLDDIKLYAADAIHTSDGYLQIGMNQDTGHIDNIKVVVGGGEADAVPVARIGETAKFESPIFEYVADKYAKVGDDVFSVANNNTNAILEVIEDARHFSGIGWELVGTGDNAVWKYKISDGQYATYTDNGIENAEFTVANNTDALLGAVKDAHHFDGGKWVQKDGLYKYVEYGDQAIYRIVDTGQTKEQLDNIADTEQFGLGHWNRIDEFMNVATFGRDIGDGQSLQYADFGHFNPVWKTKLVDLSGKVGNDWNSEDAEVPHTDEEMEEWMNQDEDYQLFAGGYAISGTELKDTLDAPKDTTFKGMAVGRLYTSLQGGDRDTRVVHFGTYGITDTGDNDDGHDIAKAFTTKDATLTIDADGKQTLSMPFNTKAVGDKYYDVTLVKNADGTIENPQFAGDATQIGAQYRLYDALDNVEETSLNMGYYGVNTASESAGTARLYSEKDIDGVVSREYELQAAWGMKKQ